MDNVDLNLDDDDDDSIVGRNVESRNYHQYQSSQQPPNFQSPLNPVRRMFWSFWPLRLHQTLNITLGGRTCPRWKMSRFEKHYLFLESRKHSRLVSGSSGTLCSWWSPIKQLLVSWSHLFHRSLSCHSLITACHECIRKQNIEKLLVRGCGHICYIIFHTVTILAIQEACFDRWHASMWISILSQPDHQFQFVTSPFSTPTSADASVSSSASTSTIPVNPINPVNQILDNLSLTQSICSIISTKEQCPTDFYPCEVPGGLACILFSLWIANAMKFFSLSIQTC